jgi:hypothetical protein
MHTVLHRFNRARGMYFSLNDRGAFSTMVYNWPHDGTWCVLVCTMCCVVVFCRVVEVLCWLIVGFFLATDP